MKTLGELKWKATRGKAVGGKSMQTGSGMCAGVILKSGKTTIWSVRKGSRLLDNGKAKSLNVAKQKVRRAMRYCTGPRRAR